MVWRRWHTPAQQAVMVLVTLTVPQYCSTSAAQLLPGPGVVWCLQIKAVHHRACLCRCTSAFEKHHLLSHFRHHQWPTALGFPSLH